MKLLDMRPLDYDTNYIKELFKSLGQNGRASYLYKQIPLDMKYPFVFATCFCLLIGYLLRRMDRIQSSLFYLTLLPLFAGIADYLENAGIIRLLTTYPNMSIAVMQATNSFSIVKSLANTALFLSLILLFISLGIGFVRKTQ